MESSRIEHAYEHSSSVKRDDGMNSRRESTDRLASCNSSNLDVV